MPEIAETARYAIEDVCSGRHLGDLERCYSPTFVDHVNSMKYHGHEGVRRSVALYRRIFQDLEFEVLEQVSEGDRVASHWKLTGVNRGRPVELFGMTISRFENGQIAEDWGYTDSIELARKLGLWRSLLVLAKEWRAVLARN